MLNKILNLKQVRIYLIVIALFGLLACSSQAAPLRVSMLMAEEAGTYQEFAQAFVSEAQRQNISLNVLQAATLPSDTDLIVAVGLKSAQVASTSHFPVLCVLVTKASFEKLLHELPSYRKQNTFSAIYFDQPIKRQVAMIVAALPEAKNIGLLLSAHSPDPTNFRKAISENGLKLHEQKLGSADSLFLDLESVLKVSDVLLAVPDVDVYNSLTMRNILLATYRRRIPIVGFSQAYVRAGALGAVFSTPGQIAIQAAYLSRQFMEKNILPTAQYPTEFDVMVNQQVARSLGISIKENSVLVREIMTATNAKEGAE